MHIVTLSIAFLTAFWTTTSAQPESHTTHPMRNFTTVDISTHLGIKRISYFEVKGHAIIYGDVVLAIITALEERRGLLKRSFSLPDYATATKWPVTQIHYKWQSKAAREGRVEAWIQAVEQWTNMLPFLIFVEHPADGPLEANVTQLVPTTGQIACYSPIGFYTSRRMFLYISCDARIVTHEMVTISTLSLQGRDI